MPVQDAMINAAAFITGGRIAPPVEAVASQAAANSGGYPRFFISGMETAPVSVILAATLPVMEPINPLESTAT